MVSIRGLENVTNSSCELTWATVSLKQRLCRFEVILIVDAK